MRINAEDLMQDRKLKTREPQNNDKIKLTIVLIAIFITVIIISIIVVLLKILKPVDTSLKIYINGEKTQVNASTFIFDGEKIYINVRDFAGRIGYTVHNGEYKIEAEDPNKIFIQNKDETASIFLNSTIISKIEPDFNGEYKNYEMSEPARKINGEMYIVSDGMEVAGNIAFAYDKETNIIEIKGLDYLYEKYKEAIMKAGYTELSEDFENKKGILYERLVVKNSDDKYGVIDLQGNEVIGTRYADVKFDEYTQEFTITNQTGKMGIDFITGETKIEVGYDEIKSIHKVNQLYLVKNNNKYGIIDQIGKILIHLEYDDIGVDLKPFINNSVVTKNTVASTESEDNKNVEKQYIFFNKIIPVKQDDKYGFFDITGKQLSELKYSGLGCFKERELDRNGRVISDNKKSTNNILTIDDYELIIVKGNNGYGIVDTNAQERVETNATDIYSVVNAGVESYYMMYGGRLYNLVTDFFEKINLKPIKQDEQSNKETTTQEQQESVVNTETNTQEENTTQEETQTTNAQVQEQVTERHEEQTQENTQNENSEQEEGN